MLEGKRFLPETGIPIWKIARIRILFEDWLPDPLAVATWIEKSLTMSRGPGWASAGAFSSRTTLTLAPSGRSFDAAGDRNHNKPNLSDGRDLRLARRPA